LDVEGLVRRSRDEDRGSGHGKLGERTTDAKTKNVYGIRVERKTKRRRFEFVYVILADYMVSRVVGDVHWTAAVALYKINRD